MTPSTPSALMASVATPWNRSRHTTSLASSRCPCAARRRPAAVASCVSFVSRKVSSIPWIPATRRSSARMAFSCAGVSGPGCVDVASALDVELLLLQQAAELRLELRLREARRGEERREVGADLGGVLADGVDLRHVVAVRRPAPPPRRSPAPTPPGGRPRGSRARRAPRGEAAASASSARGAGPAEAGRHRPSDRLRAAVFPTPASAARAPASRRRRSRNRGCRRRAPSRI